MKRIHLPETASTSSYLRALLESEPELAEWTLVDADSQTAGRGQRGNSWESEGGKNVTFSLLCRPVWLSPNRQWSLSEAMALAVCEGCERVCPGLRGLRVKWPNDIYAGERKLSGTLMECDLQGGRIGACIIGTGINVNQRVFVSDAPNPVSLCQLTGRAIDREAVLMAVVEAFIAHYERLRTEGADSLHKAYMSRLYHRDGFYEYEDADGHFRAEIAGIEPTGHLLLRRTDGRVSRYAFKEVRLLSAALSCSGEERFIEGKTANPRHIRIEDYDYDLPEERIAKFPLRERDHSKLLVYRGGEVSEDVFHRLPAYLPEGALMVMNNTRVIRARLRFRKESGALIEVFLLEPHEPADYQLNFAQRGSVVWQCMIGNLKRWKGGVLSLALSEHVTLQAERMGEGLVRLSWPDSNLSFSEILELAGELPIPPYLNRKTEASDLVTYQTVYSKVKGSVAAPTAGLHFTPQVLAALDAAGIEKAEVTLHVGAGTFKPVKSEEIGGHEMHAEHIYVPRQTIETLIRHGGRAIAIGTTSVRTLESLYYIGRSLTPMVASPFSPPDPGKSEEDWQSAHESVGDEFVVAQWEPYEMPAEEGEDRTAEYLQRILTYLDTHHLDALSASTRIIIAPGYKYHIVRAMVTNFHQPKSTLLLLVSAFVGEDWRRMYGYALSHGFRFLSYGDSSLLIQGKDRSGNP